MLSKLFSNYKIAYSVHLMSMLGMLLEMRNWEGEGLKAVSNVTVYILYLHSLQISRYSKETINRIFLDPTLLLAR